MKVYLVNEHWNNGEPYEDNLDCDVIIKVFDTKEKAINFIKTYIPEDVVEIVDEDALKAEAKKWWDEFSEDDKTYYSCFDEMVEEMRNDFRYIKYSEYRDDIETRFINTNGRYADERYRTTVIEKEVE